MKALKALKKALSVTASAAILLSGLFTVSHAQENELKLTVAADTHFQCLADAGSPLDTALQPHTEGMLNGDVYSYVTFQGQMNHESGAILREMLDGFMSSDSEYLLIAGDLTCGKRQSHLEYARLLHEVEEKSGKSVFVICGNHDCDTDSLDVNIDINEFKEIYRDFGYGEALSLDPSSASYTADLSDKYRLIAVDTCIYGKDDGELTDTDLTWIAEQAQNAKNDGKHLIAMMHHSILSHFGVQPMMKNSDKFAERLADMGIKLVFTGHLHANDISMTRTKKGNTLYDIQTGSLITAPNAYRQVGISDSEIAVESRYVTKIDTEYLPGGYTEKQLRLISGDFPSYAWGYYEAGMCRYINRYIGSAGKLGKTMKLSDGSFAYTALDMLLRKAGGALNLPIYDDGSTPGISDSIEEIARKGGKNLPESEYERIYQVVAKIMGGFYRGDEDGSLTEKEIPLLYDCLRAVISETAGTVIFDSRYTGGKEESLYERTVREISETLFSAAGTDVLIETAVGSILDGLTCDYSEPQDINVILPPYGENEKCEETAVLGVFKRIIKFILRFISEFLGI